MCVRAARSPGAFHGHAWAVLPALSTVIRIAGTTALGGGRKGVWGEHGTGAVIFRGRGRFRVSPSNDKLLYPPSPCAEWSWSDPDLALFAC